jgi:hypothetical protein
MACSALAALSLIPGVARAVDPSVQTSILDAIEGMQNLPYANVDYNFPPVQLFDGGKLVIEGSFQPLTDGTSRLHAEMRRALPSDVTYTARNSPILEDTGYRQVSAFPVVNLMRKDKNLEIRIWFAAPQGTDNFPTLRGMVTDINSGDVISCAQSVISAPLSRTINNETPAKGAACSFGSKVIYGKPDFEDLGIAVTSGVTVAADMETANAICIEKGYEGVANIQPRRFRSPGNNTVAQYVKNSRTWRVMNARAYNSWIMPGDLTCYTVKL